MSLTNPIKALYIVNPELSNEEVISVLDVELVDLHVSESGQNAVRRIREDQIDCVICGLELKDMSLNQFQKLLASTGSSIPVIAIGEPRDFESIINFINSGGDRFIRLSRTDDDLVDSVQDIALRYRMEKTAQQLHKVKDDIWDTIATAANAADRSEFMSHIQMGLSSISKWNFVWHLEYNSDLEEFTIIHPFNSTFPGSELKPYVGKEGLNVLGEAIDSGEIVIRKTDENIRGTSATDPTAITDHLSKSEKDIIRDQDSIQTSTVVIPLASLNSTGEVLLISKTARTGFNESERELFTIIGHMVGNLLNSFDQRQRITNDDLNLFMKLLAHEIRNPLSVARGNLEVALSERDWESLEVVDGAVKEIERIVDTFLLITTQKRTALETEHVAETASKAWEDVSVSEADLIFLDQFQISADQTLLERLFANLFRNSIQHAGPEVEVRIGKLSNGFYVEDNGPGIPDEVQDSLFDWGTTSREDGLGLGLGFVQMIAEAHEWSIGVIESDEGGARFEFIGTSDMISDVTGKQHDHIDTDESETGNKLSELFDDHQME